MTPVYSQAMVEPVRVERRSDTLVALRYQVPPESGYYSAGVDYQQVDDALRVVIGRCAVGEACEPMARSVIPLDDKWQAEVLLPDAGSQVILVHTDGEQPLQP